MSTLGCARCRQQLNQLVTRPLAREPLSPTAAPPAAAACWKIHSADQHISVAARESETNKSPLGAQRRFRRARGSCPRCFPPWIATWSERADQLVAANCCTRFARSRSSRKFQRQQSSHGRYPSLGPTSLSFIRTFLAPRTRCGGGGGGEAGAHVTGQLLGR